MIGSTRDVDGLAAERAKAIVETQEIFGPLDRPGTLAAIIESAFMRGAWAGAVHGGLTIFDLQEQDKCALLARIDERKAQEAADPEHQAFLKRVEARRAAGAGTAIVS